MDEWNLNRKIKYFNKEDNRLSLSINSPENILYYIHIFFYSDWNGRCGAYQFLINDEEIPIVESNNFYLKPIPGDQLKMVKREKSLSISTIVPISDRPGKKVIGCSVEVYYEPFKIIYGINGKETIEINKLNLLKLTESWSSIDFTFKSTKHTYGYGGHPTTLDLPRIDKNPFEFANRDVDYHEDHHGLQTGLSQNGGIPYIMAVHFNRDDFHKKHHDHPFFSGVLNGNYEVRNFGRINTPHFNEKDYLKPGIDAPGWIGGESNKNINLWLFSGLSGHELLLKLHSVTGFSPVPIDSFFGFHFSAKSVDCGKVLKEFDNRDIPIDSAQCHLSKEGVKEDTIYFERTRRILSADHLLDKDNDDNILVFLNTTHDEKFISNINGRNAQKHAFEKLLKKGVNRPFVSSYDFTVGSWRYGPSIPMGVRYGDWAHLLSSTPLILNMAMSGQSQVGTFVGGYEEPADNEVFIRWMQLAAYTYPLFQLNFGSHELYPWSYGNEVANYVKLASTVRQQLILYWKTLAIENSYGGRPMIRPIWFDNSDDDNCFLEGIQNTHIMVGDNILVKSATHSIKTSMNDHVYLPKSLFSHDGYFDFFSHDWKKGGDNHYVHLPAGNLPTYVRAGSVLFLRTRRRRSLIAQKDDPIALWVYCAEDPSEDHASWAHGRIFYEDGDDDIEEKKKFIYKSFDFHLRSLTSENLHLPSKYNIGQKFMGEGITRTPKIESIVFAGITIAPSSIKFRNSTDEVDILFHSFEMAHSFPPRFHIYLKNPPIDLNSDDWRIDLEGLDFSRVHKHSHSAAILKNFGEN